MGHMGVDALIAVLKKGTTRDLPTLTDSEIVNGRKEVLQCRACLEGKATRTDFGHDGLSRGRSPGEVLHMDTFETRTMENGVAKKEYTLVVSDPHTGYKWSVTVVTKDLIADKVIAIVHLARTQFDCKIRRIHMDGGSEFINKTLKDECKNLGIEMHYPPMGTQQLNGISERTVRTIKEKAKTLMHHSGASVKFWQNAVATATVLWNRTHISRVTGKTPYEAMTGDVPSAKHWGVFGCDAFYHLAKKDRVALGKHVIPCVYLGHDPNRHCAVVWDLAKEKRIWTRDVTFRNQFAFGTAVRRGVDAVREILGSDSSSQGEYWDEDGFGISLHPDSEQDPHKASSQDDQEDLEEEWEVTAITGERTLRGQTEYKVKWAGVHGKGEPWDETWQSADTLEDCEALDRWESQKTIKEEDRDDDPSEQVHMAMCAVRCSPPKAVYASVSYEMAAAVINRQVPKEYHVTPTTFKEAVEGGDKTRWEEAMDKEIAAIEIKGVWTLVRREDLPQGANILPIK
jgi:hypothetical protein